MRTAEWAHPSILIANKMKIMLVAWSQAILEWEAREARGAVEGQLKPLRQRVSPAVLHLVNALDQELVASVPARAILVWQALCIRISWCRWVDLTRHQKIQRNLTDRIKNQISSSKTTSMRTSTMIKTISKTWLKIMAKPSLIRTWSPRLHATPTITTTSIIWLKP